MHFVLHYPYVGDRSLPPQAQAESQRVKYAKTAFTSHVPAYVLLSLSSKTCGVYFSLFHYSPSPHRLFSSTYPYRSLPFPFWQKQKENKKRNTSRAKEIIVCIYFHLCLCIHLISYQDQHVSC